MKFKTLKELHDTYQKHSLNSKYQICDVCFLYSFKPIFGWDVFLEVAFRNLDKDDFQEYLNDWADLLEEEIIYKKISAKQLYRSLKYTLESLIKYRNFQEEQLESIKKPYIRYLINSIFPDICKEYNIETKRDWDWILKNLEKLKIINEID